MNVESFLNAAKVLAKEFDDADACVAKVIINAQAPSARQVEILKRILGKYPDGLKRVGLTQEDLVSCHVLDAPIIHDPAAHVPARKRIRLLPVETKYGHMIAIEFPYHPKLVSIVKALKNRLFDVDGKMGGIPKSWLIPARSEDVKEAVAKFESGQEEFEVDIDLFVQGVLEKGEQSYSESRSETADINVPTKIELYGYQKAGVKWIDDHGGRALIADEPGLGKTSQALGWIVLRSEKAIPSLVLCPATLRVTWMREVVKFTDLKSLVLSGSTSINAFKKQDINVSDRPVAGHDVTILNYDLLSVETIDTWTKMLLKEDDLERRAYAHENLVKAGRQALDLLQEKMEKLEDIESRNRLFKVYSEIEGLGEEARGIREPKHVLVYVNNVPLDDFMKMGAFRTLVVDESHYLKEIDAQRTQASLRISEKMDFVIGLTGTPILNRPRDLWSQTQVINKTIYPKFFDYGIEFCAGHKKQAGRRLVWDFSGSSNLDKLERQLRSSIMIRRTKNQVLKELPPKTRVMIPFVIEDKEERKYRKEVDPVLERLSKLRKERDEWRAIMDRMTLEERKAYVAKHAEAAAKAGRLSNEMIDGIEAVKQAAVNAKLDQCIKFLLNVHEQQGKVLVFATHHSTIDRVTVALRKEGVKVGAIDGRVTGPNRTAVVDGFQGGDTEILVCGIRAASEGLTLTASHTVVVLELDWNPGRHVQAEDRVHRISQKNAVTIYYLVVMGSIEEKIAKMIDSKREMINAALGEGDRTLDEGGILDSVLDSILG
jgi:SNF2 family DNA or RNA helicase